VSAATTLRVGIDLCSAADVADAIDRFGDRYLTRVYTDDELGACTTDGHIEPERLAGRFAAKEAALKVLRPLETGLDLRSIEIERQPGGWCEINLTGTAAELAEQAGLGDLAVSLSHEHGLATAVVVAQAAVPSPDPDVPDAAASARRAP
jgi:holo-[acyl-carrier protein] synthase